MGCLTALAALLALAIPASIAPASVVGAYVVLALLTAGACGLIAWRRPEGRRRWYGRVLAVAGVYAVVVGIIAATTR